MASKKKTKRPELKCNSNPIFSCGRPYTLKCRHKIVEAKFLSNGVSDVLDESRLVQYILSIYKEEGTDSTVH